MDMQRAEPGFAGLEAIIGLYIPSVYGKTYEVVAWSITARKDKYGVEHHDLDMQYRDEVGPVREARKILSWRTIEGAISTIMNLARDGNQSLPNQVRRAILWLANGIANVNWGADLVEGEQAMTEVPNVDSSDEEEDDNDSDDNSEDDSSEEEEVLMDPEETVTVVGPFEAIFAEPPVTKTPVVENTKHKTMGLAGAIEVSGMEASGGQTIAMILAKKLGVELDSGED